MKRVGISVERFPIERDRCCGHVNLDAMYEVMYATTRVARVVAPDSQTAKRRFAAYLLYDECDHIAFDIALSSGDDAELTPFEEDAPVTGARDDVRSWVARRDAAAETFEVALFEDPDRRIDAYLRLLATNDPWRLEGHGSLGRTLSGVPICARLVSFDGRIAYRFDAAQFLDYLRLMCSRRSIPSGRTRASASTASSPFRPCTTRRCGRSRHRTKVSATKCG